MWYGLIFYLELIYKCVFTPNAIVNDINSSNNVNPFEPEANPVFSKSQVKGICMYVSNFRAEKTVLRVTWCCSFGSWESFVLYQVLLSNLCWCGVSCLIFFFFWRNVSCLINLWFCASWRMCGVLIPSSCVKKNSRTFYS